MQFFGVIFFLCIHLFLLYYYIGKTSCEQKNFDCLWRFIIGFFLAAIPWYVAAFILLCVRVDQREKPGYVACTIAVSCIFNSLSCLNFKAYPWWSLNIYSLFLHRFPISGFNSSKRFLHIMYALIKFSS